MGSVVQQAQRGAPHRRRYYTAPAISPNGTGVYITCAAFTTPFRNDTSPPRGRVGAILNCRLSSLEI
jgi:hypothetical protein